MNRDAFASLQEFEWKKEEDEEEESFDSRYYFLNMIFFVIVLHTKTEVWKVKYESSFRRHPECHFAHQTQLQVKIVHWPVECTYFGLTKGQGLSSILY